jgi:hypothetical protein
MPNTTEADDILQDARPVVNQRGHETQPFGHLARLPIALDEATSRNSVENLNQLLADTITLRDLYKKCHWQVAGHTFYQLHLLFDKHAAEQRRSSTTSLNAYNCWAVSASRWRTTSPRGPSFRDHQRDARPYPPRYRAFCSHIKSY